MIAIIGCSLLLIFLTGAIYLISRALDDPRGKHAIGAPAGDPDEPPARHEPDDPYEPGEADWWDERPTAAPAVEVLTGPRAGIPHDSALTIGVLARVRDRLRELPPRAAATFIPAPCTDTVTDMPAVTGPAALEAVPHA